MYIEEDNMDKVVLLVCCFIAFSEVCSMEDERRPQSVPLEKAVVDRWGEVTQRPHSAPPILSKTELFERYRCPYDTEEKKSGVVSLVEDINVWISESEKSDFKKRELQIVGYFQRICSVLAGGVLNIWPIFKQKQTAKLLLELKRSSRESVNTEISNIAALFEEK